MPISDIPRSADSTALHRPLTGRWRLCWHWLRLASLLLLAVWFATPRAVAAELPGLYDGTVQLADRSEAGQAAAFAEALRQVAVRVTGRRAAATDPALASFFSNARRYVQTWRPTGGTQVTVKFDAVAVDGALSAAGQPLWPNPRPTTLVLMVSEPAGQPRQLLGAATGGDNRKLLDRVAELRGITLVWPTLDPADQPAQRVEDIVAGRVAPLQTLAQRYGADGLLYGRMPAGAAATGAWTTVVDGVAEPARGSATDALQALADRYAARYAVAGAGLVPQLITVSGINGLSAYASLVGYLESLNQIRDVAVEAAEGDQLRLRLSFRGSREALQRVLVMGGRLSEVEAGIDGLPRFRYQASSAP